MTKAGKGSLERDIQQQQSVGKEIQEETEEWVLQKKELIREA